MEKIKVANKYQKSIDLLNDALGKEIATSLQYMYFHVHFEDAGYEYLSKKMRMISIAEMRHSEELSDRILFLQGDVNMNPSFPTRQITDPKEMFRFAMQLEQSTIDSYNDAARIAAEADDSVTHKMFQDLAVEEEEHLTISATSCRTCSITATRSTSPCNLLHAARPKPKVRFPSSFSSRTRDNASHTWFLNKISYLYTRKKLLTY